MSKVTDAGDELFALFEKTVSLPAEKIKGGRGSEAQIQLALERFYVEAKSVRSKHRMGLISRARVVRHFQSRMVARGYPAALVKQVTFALIVSAFIGRAG